MLTAAHSLPRAKDRKAVKQLCNYKGKMAMVSKNDKDFMKTDVTIDKVYADIAVGAGKSAVMKKIMAGEYQNNPVKRRQAFCIYKAALDRFAIDRDEDAERLRDILYARYETILQEAMKKGDLFNARCVLDSIAKVFLGVDKKVVNIENNADNVVVTFGFKHDDNEKDNIEEADFQEV